MASQCGEIIVRASSQQNMSLARRAQSSALDQFYTKAYVANELLQDLLFLLRGRTEGAIWVEPSVGEGAFYTLLPSPRLGIDLQPGPNLPDIIQGDFLSWRAPDDAKYIVVGNPPFGRNGATARAFLRHAASFAEVVAFVLPASFQKPSMLQRVPKDLHLLYQKDLPEDAFIFCGKTHMVRCIFQVWEKRHSSRPHIEEIAKHPDFEFTRDVLEADFAIQRVGSGAGKLKLNPAGCSRSSHYFVRVQTDLKGVLSRFEALDLTPFKRQTVSNPSISQQEIFLAYAAEL